MEKVFNNELISIIVPLYNMEEHIKECIDSIKNQDYKNIEVILVDDGSTDSSLKICEEYAKKDKRMKVIHKENEGVSATRNVGIEASNGKWITFVDADDWIEKDYVSSMYEVAIKYKSNYVVCGYKRVYRNRVEYVNNDKNIIEIDPENYLKKLLNVQNGYGFCHMKLIKKEIINNNPFNPYLRVGEDALFNVELCKKINKTIILNRSLYNYRFNEKSMVRKYDIQYASKYQYSMEKMKEYIKENYKGNKEIEQNLQNYISYHVLLIAVNYCYNKKNNNKYKSLINMCKVPLFYESINKSNYEDMSITRKVTLFMLKHRVYIIVGLICRIRQNQFSK